MDKREQATYEVRIDGLVQGVGFRPFIYRLAHAHGLKGRVWNTNECVFVTLQGGEESIRKFIDSIPLQAPPAAQVESVTVRKYLDGRAEDFTIDTSTGGSERITRVSPDISVCDDCLQDMHRQANRLDYPFINCTNCGPRFTIIRSLPYDRAGTTMKDFTLCASCAAEYDDILDRRFHAQPVACSDCGPHYSLRTGTGRLDDQEDLIKHMAHLIDQGRVVAVKGMGGYHLACDALNSDAVDRLRRSKLRESKPFAVMFRDLEAVSRYAGVTEEEVARLVSWRRPIVVLRSGGRLPEGISNGLGTVGAMLPYMPLHHLLFRSLETPVIVLTSGNLSDEPIVTDDWVAESILGPVSSAVLEYDREIFNRCDDSVLFVENGSPRLIRRSRGYAPDPVNTALDLEGIFAAGAELVNCFALGKGRQAILSQHIGDLKNLETYDFYRQTYERFCSLFRFSPALAACDLHPDYLSTVFARGLGVPVTGVQHHHAHIASVLAEHRLDCRVIGVSLDGTGYGTDGHTWGSEFMICDLEGFERITHFRYMPMPGGDLATKQPWRMALAVLLDAMGEGFEPESLPAFRRVDPGQLRMVGEALGKKINTPLSSGAGRLFDAVSAMLGLCIQSGFHAEAPMRLENAADPGARGAYDFACGDDGIDFRPAIIRIVKEIRKGVPVSCIAARFHNTVLNAILSGIDMLRKESGIDLVVFSGGSFQNRYLLGRLEKALGTRGMKFLTNSAVPVNDGGLALGQMAVAAKRREQGPGPGFQAHGSKHSTSE